MNKREVSGEVSKMSKKNKSRDDKKNKNRKECFEDSQHGKGKVAPPIKAKNGFQRKLLNALRTMQIVVCDAPAGVGKSTITMSHIIDKYVGKDISNIKLSRPAVGMGNSLGLLKGSLEEKYEPYLLPLIDVVRKRYGYGLYQTGLRNGNIELLALEYARGRNIEEGEVLILDEAQNTTPDECYSIITRVCDGGQLIIIGDRTQKDLKGMSGLEWVEKFINRHGLQDTMCVVKSTSEDIVRGSICKEVVKAKELDVTQGYDYYKGIATKDSTTGEYYEE